MNEDEITGVQYASVTVVRVTPLRGDGSPDHPWAMTYHLDEPILFGIGTVECLPSFTRAPDAGTCLDFSRRRTAGALVAGYGHPQYRNVQAIAQGLWQRRRTGASVETWCESGPGRWGYLLVPWWRHQTDTDWWPVEDLPDHRAYALGDCLPVDHYVWPSPPPVPAPHALQPRTQLVLAETTTAPPPPGLAPYPGAAA
ncbi:hypothetical protein ACFXKY_15725 [Streptomyces canus]|uniref:hypothetical protein n=1 Tax=Streptomyces canus TaxID=58343 RepID=UPI0036CA6DB7